MEDILKFENREQLYKFLIDDFDFIKVEEKYDEKSFGNFYIILSAKDFLLNYVNDRDFLDINIAGKSEPTHWLPLSFVRDFIYHPAQINVEEKADNATRIRELNNFLRKDFNKISELFSKKNYLNTRKRIDKLLKAQFKRRFPHFWSTPKK